VARSQGMRHALLAHQSSHADSLAVLLRVLARPQGDSLLSTTMRKMVCERLLRWFIFVSPMARFAACQQGGSSSHCSSQLHVLLLCSKKQHMSLCLSQPRACSRSLDCGSEGTGAMIWLEAITPLCLVAPLTYLHQWRGAEAPARH